VDQQDIFAPLPVGQSDHDLAIEATGTEDCGVEHVRAVGSREDDHFMAVVEAIHFDQHLVQSLLTLVVDIANTRAAPAPDSVQLVDEHNRRRGLFRLFEQVAHPAGAHPDKHLDELRTAEMEERSFRFSSHRPRHQRLSGPRRSHQQYAPRNVRSEIMVLLGPAQEVHDLLQVFLGFICTGHHGENHLGRFAGVTPRFAAAEVEGSPLCARRLAPHPEQDNHQEDDGQGRHQQVGDQWAGGWGNVHLHSVRF
jgi:hypothetical protein